MPLTTDVRLMLLHKITCPTCKQRTVTIAELTGQLQNTANQMGPPYVTDTKVTEAIVAGFLRGNDVASDFLDVVDAFYNPLAQGRTQPGEVEPLAEADTQPPEGEEFTESSTAKTKRRTS